MAQSGQRQFNIPECPAHAHVYTAEFRLAMSECVIILGAFGYLLPKAPIESYCMNVQADLNLCILWVFIITGRLLGPSAKCFFFFFFFFLLLVPGFPIHTIVVQ